MTRTQIANLRNTLEAKRAELLQGLNQREEIHIERATEELDAIQNAVFRDLAAGRLNRDSGLLRQVQAALERLDNQTYGTCLWCDEDIALRRLSALPWAALCIRCQEEADASRLTGDPVSGGSAEPAARFALVA